MSTIVCLHTLPPEHAAKIRSTAPGWTLIHGEKEQWMKHLPEAEIVAAWNGDAEQACLKPDAKLKWIQMWGAGVNGMPFEALKRKGIVVTNASGVHAFPISESLFAMMLAFARKLHLAVRQQQAGKWGGLGELGELHGRTAGIIGVGAIGEETARLAQAFGMRVLGVRRSGEPSEYVDRMCGLSGLDEVLRESDFVIVTLPLTDETRGLFGREQFRMMKSSAVYLNIGRGGTTDTEALIAALQRGEIAGAGLDVFEQEPLPATSPLWEMDNVIMTPHNAGSTVHYGERILDIFLHNLHDYVQGKAPSRNRVDLDKQY